MQFLRNLKIQQKQLLLIMVSILCLGIVGFLGYEYMQEMAHSSVKMYSENLKPIDWLGEIKANNRAIDSYTLDSLLTTDPVKKERLKKLIEKASLTSRNLVNEYEKSDLSPEEKQKLEIYYNAFNKYHKARQIIWDLLASNENKKAYQYYTDVLIDARGEVNHAIEELQKFNIELAEQINKENQEKQRKASIILLMVIVTGAITSSLIGLLITRVIVNPVNQMKELMSNAENGDFSINGDYRSKDEIGQLMISFNNMIGGLRGIIKTVSETAELVAASSEELSASTEQSTKASEHITLTIQDLAEGANHQVKSVEESTYIINKMADYTERIMKNADEMRQNAINTVGISNEGKKSLHKVINQMNMINENMISLENTIKGLGQRSNEIGRINEVITTIAAQTNLLALNAAIEAARAGGNGRGFSVVADEVRKLAEQSANSAEQITNLIQVIQQETNQTIESMDLAVKEVDTGLRLVEETGLSFNNIETSINGVVAQIKDVSSSISELTSGTIQVTNSINSVKAVTEESAASSQNISAATEEQLASMEDINTSVITLSKVSEDLRSLIRKFTI
ncbi:methyl-accepting chemotaxis protein [Metabacillus fastidiosus]|uniref:methyl-accepting chemotaxis protein n=1 Tax=Metabacillus fastidiosus TaxID=1458 RepID=UPI002DC023C1|nr:methyl-accepting chemotaxis protein [Metabacillus fastidiosus]MEC2074531.1 methyl-accepting chemotaxis protein [Metabacillus fastidiosus]